MATSVRRWLAATVAMVLAALVGVGPSVRAFGATTMGTTYLGTPGFAMADQAPPPGPGRAPGTQQKGARPVHQGGPAGLGGLSGPAPTAAPGSGPSGTLRHNFNGVSSLDSAKANFGAQFEPPDQGLCAGNGFVLEPVNSAYTIYRANGAALVGPFNVNDLFNVGAQEFTSDPRCYYDPATNRWFALILFVNSATTASSVDLAVSASGDPTQLWHEYRIDTTDDGRHGEPSHVGCPCLGDQPTLGIDQHNLYFTTNEFALVGPQANGAQIYAVAKADLVASVAAPHLVHFDHLTIGGTSAMSVQPALSTGAPNAEYFMNSLDPNGLSDHHLGVWAMTNRGAVARGQSPRLSSTVIRSESYGVPPKAEQMGSRSLVDSGDDRMQQTQFIGGELWGELTTAVTIPGDRSERAGAAWFAVRPTITGGDAVSAAVHRQGYVVSSREYVIYPAIQADSSGRAAMGVTLTGRDRFPSTAYAVLAAPRAAFGPVTVSADGTGPYDRRATRWGDYGWAVLDPAADAVWLANEYVPPKVSQTTDGVHNWGTRVVEVSLG